MFFVLRGFEGENIIFMGTFIFFCLRNQDDLSTNSMNFYRKKRL